MTINQGARAVQVSVTLDHETLALADSLADALHLQNRSAAVRAAIHAYAEHVLAATPAGGHPTPAIRP